MNWPPAPVPHAPVPHAPVPPAPGVAPARLATPSNYLAFFFASLFLFSTYGRLSENISILVQASVPLAQIISAICLLGVLISGGALTRTITSRFGILIILYTLWLACTLPFSTWRGGSFAVFTQDWLRSVFAFFIVGALILSIEHVRKSFFVIILSVISIAAFSLRFGTLIEGRYAFIRGTLANSNDFGIHVLLVLPMCVVYLSSRHNLLIRLMSLLTAGWIIYRALQTGSRTCVLMAGVMIVLTFVLASSAVRIRLLLVAIPLILVAQIVVPSNLRARYGTLFTTDVSEEDQSTVYSAQESTAMRQRLFWYSVRLAAENPLFGVGLGNFAGASTKESEQSTEKVFWHAAHNIYGQIAAETGLPGIFLYLSILFVSIRSCWKICRSSRNRPPLAELYLLAGCLLTCQVAYAVSSIFGTSTYGFYVPLFTALTCALQRAAQDETGIVA